MAFYVLRRTYMSPRIIAYLTERVVLFLYPTSFPKTLFWKYQFFRSYYRNNFLLAWYVSCACKVFSVDLIFFAIYVKDSQCLVEAATWEIVGSTYRRQSEYFDQWDVARLLTCYIYNGPFAKVVYGWTLQTAIITKSSILDLAGYPRYTSFTSNSKMLKRHS